MCFYYLWAFTNHGVHTIRLVYSSYCLIIIAVIILSVIDITEHIYGRQLNINFDKKNDF